MWASQNRRRASSSPPAPIVSAIRSFCIESMGVEPSGCQDVLLVIDTPVPDLYDLPTRRRRLLESRLQDRV
jgi:hypothetical protein